MKPLAIIAFAAIIALLVALSDIDTHTLITWACLLIAMLLVVAVSHCLFPARRS